MRRQDGVKKGGDVNIIQKNEKELDNFGTSDALKRAVLHWHCGDCSGLLQVAVAVGEEAHWFGVSRLI